MPRPFFTLLFLVAAAAAQSPQDRVRAHFAAELRIALRSMLEDRIARKPDDVRTQQLRQNLDQEIEEMIPRAFNAFSPELTISETEAAALLTNGPNDVRNREEIQKNRILMDQSPLPKPTIVSFMFKQADTAKDVSGWRLETLSRLVVGTVRQLKERGELK